MFSQNNLRATLTNRLKITNLLAILALGSILLTLSSCGNEKSDRQTAKNKDDAPIVTGQRLETVKQRGKLICGIDDTILGFSYKEADGSYSGISVDLCKAIAAALFDDPTKVEYRHLEAAERFSAVTSGEVDLLSRNTTWNLSRDTSGGLEFPPTNFYDGQGILVGKNSGIKKLDDLNGKSICVAGETTAEVNLEEQLRKYNIGYSPLVFENSERLYQAYDKQECDAATSDRSELVARQSRLSNPQAHTLLNSVISKEPLGPVIANDEPAWFDVVKWVSYATITAEELGISSANIDDLSNSKNPKIERFLGMKDNLGTELGIPDDFAKRVVKHVGNYGEIYDRNIGKPFGLERGINALWIDGGSIYAPPFR